MGIISAADYIGTYRLSLDFTVGLSAQCSTLEAFSPKVMGVPITFNQVSSIITVMATVWTLFNKHVSDPNVYIITLECMRTVNTCREVGNYCLLLAFYN